MEYTSCESLGVSTKAGQLHYYLVQPEGRRLFELNLGPVALAFSAATDEDSVREINRMERVHGERWPFAWLDRKGVAYEALL